MKLKRLLMPVVVLGIMFGMVGAAEAAISCSVASAPVSRAIATGHTEVAGDLTFLCTGTSGATTTTTLTVDLGVPITNSTTYPAGFPIQITGVTGDFATVAPTIASVSNSTGQIIINLPAVAAPVASRSFSLRGVRVSLNGSGKSSLTATVSVGPGSNYFIEAGENVATVITTILQGLGTPCLGSTTTTTTSGGVTTCSSPSGAVPATLLTNGTSGTGLNSWSITIPENFIDALRDSTQITGTAPTNDVQIAVTLAGIPAGVTIGGTGGSACTVSASAAGGLEPTPTLSATSFTSLAPTVTISWSAAMNLTAIDTVTLTCPAIDTSAATLPLTAGTVTATVTLSPTGNALTPTSTNPTGVLTTATTGQIPRYQSSPSAAITVVNIIPATTTFLIPYVTTTSTFDTGLAISNTTADPFTAPGAGGARAQSGTVTFTFFPVTGSSFSYTTSATSPTGNGGLASGVLASGKTYTVLATELLTAAGFATPRAFSGYVIAVANFTNGHGAAFITDFKGFTSATDVLVMSPPALFDRNIKPANNFVESLGK
jgi:hypothetical protein